MAKALSPSFKNPILKRTIVADILLSLGPPPDPRLRPQNRTPNPDTWSGAWLYTLTWLSAAPCEGARHIRSYLDKLPEAHAGGETTLAALPPLHATFVLHAFDAALDARLADARAGGAGAEYLAHFCPSKESSGVRCLVSTPNPFPQPLPLHRPFSQTRAAKALMCRKGRHSATFLCLPAKARGSQHVNVVFANHRPRFWMAARLA